jgi:hypothetical protein
VFSVFGWWISLVCTGTVYFVEYFAAILVIAYKRGKHFNAYMKNMQKNSKCPGNTKFTGVFTSQ